MRRGGFLRRDRLLLIAILALIAGVTLWGSDDSTGYAVADCVDEDGDGFYPTACSIEDLGCDGETAYVAVSGNQQGIDVSSDYMVYKDDSSGDWDVYLYDFSSGSSSALSDPTITDIGARTFGDFVVWQSLVSGVWQVSVYDILSGSGQVLLPSQAHQVGPDVSADWIVWSDIRSGNWDIYGYDLAMGTEQALITGSSSQTNPRILGDSIVYADDVNGNADIYLYDLSTGTSAQVSSGSGTEALPDVSEEFVVWQTDENGNSDIYAYDLVTSETIVIAESSADERLPRISGSVVVWMANDGNDFEIYYYDLLTGVGGQVTNDDAQQIVPVIDADTVFWQDMRSGDFDIYGKIIDADCAVVTGDCDDSTAAASPIEAEVCDDAIDNNCDTQIDEGCVIAGCAADEECGQGYSCLDGQCILAEEVTCASQWDCSNVEWSECIDEVSTRDLGQCAVIPTDEACFAEEFIPASSQECISDVSPAAAASLAEEEALSTGEEVPIFTWINLLLVIGILIGYYAWRK